MITYLEISNDVVCQVVELVGGQIETVALVAAFVLKSECAVRRIDADHYRRFSGVMHETNSGGMRSRVKTQRMGVS